jgi:nitrogen fixation NifU-like protein
MQLAKTERDRLRRAGFSTRIIRLYEEMANVGFFHDPDAAVDYKGPCGDIIKFYLQIAKNHVIDDARFQYIGCPALAASGSILSEMVKHRTVQEAQSITANDVLDKMERLPDHECHCAELATTALRKTLAQYEANGSLKGQA